MTRPRVNEEGQKELRKAEEGIAAFQESLNQLPNDPNVGKSVEQEPQTLMSKKEIKDYDALYLQPVRSISCRMPFNEKYRKDSDRSWERIKCIVENHEMINEIVDVWTHKFAGEPYHFWKVPVNKPIYIPRLLAEQLSKCCYNRLKMEEASASNLVSNSPGVEMVGALQVSHKVNRISARPVGFEF